jgi:uncharacterized glyoxalase superfamily protein PhnB
MEQRIFPYLLYEDGAAAIEFLTEAFGFREEMRTGDEGMHAELEAPDGGWVHLGQRRTGFSNPSVAGSTSLVYVIVDDVDDHYARAKAAGARIIDEPRDLPYGRSYGCSDPQGHVWYFTQAVADA